MVENKSMATGLLWRWFFPLTKLLALNGVSYDYSCKPKRDKLQALQNEAAKGVLSTEASADKAPLTEKEKQDAAKMEARKNIIEKPEHRIGFIAQDLQKVFPDLVVEDDMGYLGIDYISLIPVIIEAMKDQQQIIGAQSAKIKELEGKLSLMEYPGDPIITPIKPIKTKSDRSENTLLLDENNTFLFQNTPNPFTQTTEIRYFLPENTTDAKLYIFNIQGQNVKTVELQGKGMGSITIKAAEFAPGTYTYMLHANGKELDAKRMILTK